MSVLAVIPARFASTRFPGKPLAVIGGKTMINRVYEQVSKALNDVVVATDDERIFDEVKSFGGKVVMTSANHQSGTDRCFEALTLIGNDFDIVVNIQGDEPFIQPEQILQLIDCFRDKSVEIATLARKIEVQEGNDFLFNPNVVKVTFNQEMNALYFSRSVIPYLRNVNEDDYLKQGLHYTHIGMYAFRTEVLKQIVALPQSVHEKSESLEQLRWLDHGYSIRVAETNYKSFGIDTPEDLEEAARLITL